MMKTLFENAVVLTMDDDMRLISNGYVLTEGKNIAEVGEGTYGGEADERIDAHGGILLPGFVNTHCHASMVPFRTMGDDCPDRLRRFLLSAGKRSDDARADLSGRGIRHRRNAACRYDDVRGHVLFRG